MLTIEFKALRSLYLLLQTLGRNYGSHCKKKQKNNKLYSCFGIVVPTLFIHFDDRTIIPAISTNTGPHTRTVTSITAVVTLSKVCTFLTPP